MKPTEPPTELKAKTNMAKFIEDIRNTTGLNPYTYYYFAGEYHVLGHWAFIIYAEEETGPPVYVYMPGGNLTDGIAVIVNGNAYRWDDAIQAAAKALWPTN